MDTQLEEITADLFTLPTHISLAHCVSQDLHMGKGIAKTFKSVFGSVNQLRSQNVSIGGVGYIQSDSNRYIFYLVTKHRYFHRPTYATLRSSLMKCKDLCVELEVRHLAIPKIGCGLDRLEWQQVREIIKEVFMSSNVRITVCSI